jgi:hypothetical protein
LNFVSNSPRSLSALPSLLTFCPPAHPILPHLPSSCVLKIILPQRLALPDRAIAPPTGANRRICLRHGAGTGRSHGGIQEGVFPVPSVLGVSPFFFWLLLRRCGVRSSARARSCMGLELHRDVEDVIEVCAAEAHVGPPVSIFESAQALV